MDDIASLKASWVMKHRWAASAAQVTDATDLYIEFRRKREPDRRYVLRLRYQSGWKGAGRREEFVNPSDYSDCGPQYWPQNVDGINPTHNPPAICLKGSWGYHSVLHTGESAEGTSLNRFLKELQQVMDR